MGQSAAGGRVPLAGLEALRSNADCAWDTFDSEAYLRRNYQTVHDLDRIIISSLGPFLAKFRGQRFSRALDVGTGTNLYPALAMLPIAKKITLWEYSATNVEWLRSQTRPYHAPWDTFWSELVDSSPMYRDFPDPARALSAAVRIEKASIFDLEPDSWDLGTMFFVAESITGEPAEFEEAVRRFIRSVRPGKPFVAAFVENSQGYPVGDQWLPAVPVRCADIVRVLSAESHSFDVHPIESPDRFRDGYDGMILVTGIRRPAGSSGAPPIESTWTRPSLLQGQVQ